jgi:hypothetical protein
MTHPYRDVPQEITEHRVWLDVYTLTMKEGLGEIASIDAKAGLTRSERTRSNYDLDASARERARMAVCAFRQLHIDMQRAPERSFG